HFNGTEGEDEMDGPSYVYVESSFLPEKRDHPDVYVSYNCLHAWSLNDSVIVLHYAVDTSDMACPREMRHIYHKLVTMDKVANIIDQKLVGGQSGEYLGTMQCENGNLVLSTWKRTWKKP